MNTVQVAIQIQDGIFKIQGEETEWGHQCKLKLEMAFIMIVNVILKVSANTSQLGNCFSDISVAYTYLPDDGSCMLPNVGKTISQLASVCKNL